MSYTDGIDAEDAAMEQDKKEREKRSAGEAPHQRYFTAAIFVIDYNEPDIDTFWTKEEAEFAAIEFWNKAYGLTMETMEELNQLDMRSGDFCWIKPVLIPANPT
ncbi:MAG: hypothetical protein NXH70_02195 [Hyphomonas sp.]|nr:hypothetical protein [Hyphomonas sp.]